MEDPSCEDPVSSTSLQVEMDFPVTASLGPVGPLLRQLRSRTHEHLTVMGVSEEEIQILRKDLEVLCISLMNHSEAEKPSLSWMREIRELCYDTNNYFDDDPFIWKQDEHAQLQLTPQEKQEIIQLKFNTLKARAKHAIARRERYEIDLKNIKKVKFLTEGSRLLPVLHAELIDLLAKKLMGVAEGKQRKVVVSLVGHEGVGKTTLAKRVYRKTGGEFQCRAFVRASPNPDMRMFLTSILTQIQLKSSSDGVSEPACYLEAQDLITKIKNYLREKRYLIIVDDLWSISVWDIIRRAFPDGDRGSRIVTTTQFEDVASACCSYQRNCLFKMEPLNDEQSRKLLFGNVFSSQDHIGRSEDYVEVSNGIISKCGGLPLLIANVASLLPTGSELDLQGWMEIRDSLPSTMGRNPISEGIREVLNFIYNNLSPQLKTCLLYLAIYPEGYTVSKHDLVKLWVVEGFIGEGENKEEIAWVYFDQLVSRGMIQAVDVNDGGVLSCTLHHMVHDLIVKKSMEDNFIIRVDNFQSAIWLPDKVRRLSVQFGGATSADIPDGIAVSEVRSLAFFGFYGCTDFIDEYKLLRVLTLDAWANQDGTAYDLSVISKLLRLRYLKIACNITVKLPDQIQALQYLETLEVDATVVAIPSDIGLLGQLSSLKIAVRQLSVEDIGILQALRQLSALSLHVWAEQVEMMFFPKGNFSALKYFKFRCCVPCLKFEAGSMPVLQNLNLCFNAHKAHQHHIKPIGIEQLPGLKEITAEIWGGAHDYVGTFEDAIRNYPSKPTINVHVVDCIFHGEDEKKKDADSSMSTSPQSKRMSSVPVQGPRSISLLGDMGNAFHLLETITNNFSNEQKVGSGGYGDVYKGVYNGKEIAVKKLHSFQGLDDKAFDSEFRNLSKVQHENVVPLLGYYYQIVKKYVWYNKELVLANEKRRILCFEYMEGGSLDKHIEDEYCSLDWHTCYQIIKGTCDGLNHLHGAHEKPIFHLDLKPSNILLDKDMTAKIADLGLSRLVASTETHKTQTFNMKGTLGYMPPEYIDGRYISKRYDVFSLGVIILKIMAGNKGHYCCYEMSKEQFTKHVIDIWEGKLQETSRCSSHEKDILQMKKCIDIALKCVENDRYKRPLIKDIVHELEELEAKIKEMSLYSDMSTDLIGQTSSNSSVLAVDPAIELRFLFEPRKDISTCLQLANQTDGFVEFRVITNQAKYSTTPTKGIMQPCSKRYISVTLRAQDEAPANMRCDDMFLVQSAPVSEDPTLTEDEVMAGPAVGMVRLPIVYVGSDQFQR